jgi:hypothetical protein
MYQVYASKDSRGEINKKYRVKLSKNDYNDYIFYKKN